MNEKKNEWEKSYLNKDNFVFFPHEEVIRFFAKYISKRIGLNEYREVKPSNVLPKVLDLGCGIGRHVIFANQMKTDAYGIEISEEALKTALKWAKEENIANSENKIVQGSITEMPFENEFFDFVVSHGVLDSMEISIITAGIKETARVMKTGGLFYCDLIGPDNFHAENFCGPEVVTTLHEKDTIQFYYNEDFIKEIFEPFFEIVEMVIIRRQNLISEGFISRFHIVFKKKA